MQDEANIRGECDGNYAMKLMYHLAIYTYQCPHIQWEKYTIKVVLKSP